MTEIERQQLGRLRASLGGWALADIRKAASRNIDLPRLAFLGVAAFLDQMSRLFATKPSNGFNAWMEFVPRYMPSYQAEAEVRLLYKGLRGTMLHEYGTRNVGLTHANHQLHLVQHGDIRILNLENLVSECEIAFEKFCSDIESDPVIRGRVLPRTQGLLAPVEIVVPPKNPVSNLSGLMPQFSALSASATAADGSIRFHEPEP